MVITRRSDDNGIPKHWSAGVFKRDVINKALKELGQLYPKTLFNLTTFKHGRNVTGYKLDIHSVQTNLDMNTVIIDGVPQENKVSQKI